jgi:hypothetical protein
LKSPCALRVFLRARITVRAPHQHLKYLTDISVIWCEYCAIRGKTPHFSVSYISCSDMTNERTYETRVTAGTEGLLSHSEMTYGKEANDLWCISVYCAKQYGSRSKFICFLYDGYNLSNTEARQVGFNTELDHRHRCTLRITCCFSR